MQPFPFLTGKEQLSYLKSILRDLNDSDENDGDDDMDDTGSPDDDSTPEDTGSPDDDLYPGGTGSADDSENTITGYEQDENDATKRGILKTSYEEDDDEDDEDDESSEGVYQENDDWMWNPYCESDETLTFEEIVWYDDSSKGDNSTKSA